jgi:hypothetical protein
MKKNVGFVILMLFNDAVSATESRMRNDFVIKVYIKGKRWKVVNPYVNVSTEDGRMTTRIRQILKLKKMTDY